MIGFALGSNLVFRIVNDLASRDESSGKILDVHLVGLTVSSEEFAMSIRNLIHGVSGRIYVYTSNTDPYAGFHANYLEVEDPVCTSKLTCEKLAIAYLAQSPALSTAEQDFGMILEFIRKKIVLCDISSLTQSGSITQGYQANADLILEKFEKDLFDPVEELSLSNSPTKKSFVKKIISLDFS